MSQNRKERGINEGSNFVVGGIYVQCLQQTYEVVNISNRIVKDKNLNLISQVSLRMAKLFLMLRTVDSKSMSVFYIIYGTIFTLCVQSVPGSNFAFHSFEMDNSFQ